MIRKYMTLMTFTNIYEMLTIFRDIFQKTEGLNTIYKFSKPKLPTRFTVLLSEELTFQI